MWPNSVLHILSLAALLTTAAVGSVSLQGVFAGHSKTASSTVSSETLEHITVAVCPDPVTDDCPSIRVIRPPDTDANAKLPVLFWVYDLFPESEQYDPTGLLQFADNAGKAVIYATVLYRPSLLDSLGENADEQTVIRAAAADQVNVLEWTAQNIDQYGGDKTRVTVFGQTASLHELVYREDPYVLPFQQVWSLSHPIALFPTSLANDSKPIQPVNIVLSWLDDAGGMLAGTSNLDSDHEVREALSMWFGKRASSLSPYRHLTSESIDYILENYPLEMFSSTSEKISPQWHRVARIIRDALFVAPALSFAWQNYVHNERSGVRLMTMNLTNFQTSPDAGSSSDVPYALRNRPTLPELSDTYLQALITFAHTGSPSSAGDWPLAFTDGSISRYERFRSTPREPPPSPLFLSMQVLHPDQICFGGPTTVTYHYKLPSYSRCGTPAVEHDEWARDTVWGRRWRNAVSPLEVKWWYQKIASKWRSTRQAVTYVLEWINGDRRLSNWQYEPWEPVSQCERQRHEALDAQRIPDQIATWRRLLASDYGARLKAAYRAYKEAREISRARQLAEGPNFIYSSMYDFDLDISDVDVDD